MAAGRVPESRMKYLSSTFLASVMGERQMRRNVGALLKYVAFLTAIVLLYAVIFHVIMWNVEGQRHSWITGIYWSLTVMSTLGFGDITFESDAGRLFSIIVLLSGIVLLLILLPFVFIRYFYAPWLEAQVRLRAPREVPAATRDHVLITSFEEIAEGLVAHLKLVGIPCFVLDPDPVRSAQLAADGVPVLAGEVENRETYVRAAVGRARLVLANGSDTANTNVVLTVREVAPHVPIAAVAALEDSIDILALAGATHVLPLKQRLGEHLASRVNAGRTEAHVIGRFRELLIAEFPLHDTSFAGRRIRESRLRETTGLNVIGVWEEAQLRPAAPDTLLANSSVPVVVGTESQINKLNELLATYETNERPVLVLGGGKVGRSAARSLKRRGVRVHIIEKKPELRERIGNLPDRLFLGDAANRDLLMEAGLAEAPSVLLTTNDDAMNVYLAVYCRRLNAGLRIVSRITHERNIGAIRRAGADIVLSYAALGLESVVALLEGRSMVFLGEGIELHQLEVPAPLVGKTLAESELRARTQLNVIAVESPAGEVTIPHPDEPLEAGAHLLMIGEPDRMREFLARYSRG